VLRIRIGFNADPDTDQDPAFFVIRIRIPIKGFDGQKVEKVSAEIKIIFFGSKIAIYFSPGLQKERPSYRRSLHPSKEKI
jgi:hypothetical protein